MAVNVKKKLLSNDKPPLSPSKYAPTGPFLVNAKPSTDINKNTSWFDYPGVWTMYILIILFSWSFFVMVGFPAIEAWIPVHLIHFVVTYYFFHWKKGSPFSEDQGVYDKLTWWEQVDSGTQLTRNRKFLTVLPVVLYILANHSEDFGSPICLINTIAVLILLIAKLPSMHKVRILGINADYPT